MFLKKTRLVSAFPFEKTFTWEVFCQKDKLVSLMINFMSKPINYKINERQKWNDELTLKFYIYIVYYFE